MQSEHPPATRIAYFEYLRTYATVGVVLLHASSLLLSKVYSHEVSPFWSEATVVSAYETAGRFAVNCFFMISGALLLDPSRRFRLGRQASRVAIPLVIWSGAYILANWFYARHDKPLVGGTVGEPNLHAPIELVRNFLSGGVAVHLWFVYVLLGIYLVVPLLRAVTNQPEPQRRSLLLYALGLWGVFQVGMTLGPRVWDGWPDIYSGLLPDFPMSYLGIFLLGFVLHTYRVPGGKPLYLAMVVIGFVWIVWQFWYEHHEPGRSTWSTDNLQPPIILLSAGVFLLAKTVMSPAAVTGPLVSLFSRLSFRIYLVHLLVLDAWRHLSPLSDFYWDHPVLAVPLVTVLTVLSSFAIAWLIEQIKPIRSYV